MQEAALKSHPTIRFPKTAHSAFTKQCFSVEINEAQTKNHLLKPPSCCIYLVGNLVTNHTERLINKTIHKRCVDLLFPNTHVCLLSHMVMGSFTPTPISNSMHEYHDLVLVVASQLHTKTPQKNQQTEYSHLLSLQAAPRSLLSQ